MLTDYLAAAPLICERLRARIAELQIVETLQDVEGLEARVRNANAAAFVIYDGDRLLESAGRGQAQPVRQRWLVVLAVRNARDPDTGAGVRADAGRLLSDALRALQGWQPTTDFRPLVRVAGPRPGYRAAFAYYPLAFEAQIATIGD